MKRFSFLIPGLIFLIIFGATGLVMASQQKSDSIIEVEDGYPILSPEVNSMIQENPKIEVLAMISFGRFVDVNEVMKLPSDFNIISLHHGYLGKNNKFTGGYLTPTDLSISESIKLYNEKQIRYLEQIMNNVQNQIKVTGDSTGNGQKLLDDLKIRQIDLIKNGLKIYAIGIKIPVGDLKKLTQIEAKDIKIFRLDGLKKLKLPSLPLE